MIGISACLGGQACRYGGGTKTISELVRLVEEGQAVMICPEVIGGLPTPRPAAGIVGGDGVAVWQGQARVIDRTGTDVTELFKQGAIKAYQSLKDQHMGQLILKDKSPSCGSQFICDGSFSGNQVTGVGVATAYFIKQGIDVLTDHQWQRVKTVKQADY